jgi:peptidoglycan LD-endopeptidase LytH
MRHANPTVSNGISLARSAGPRIGQPSNNPSKLRAALLPVLLLLASAGCSANRTSVPVTTVLPVAAPTAAPTTTVAPTITTQAPTTTTISARDRILANPAGEVEHSYLLAAGVNSSYARTHSGYSATDVFANCGSEVLAMATGVIDHVRAVDTYVKATDNPALRGGKSVAVLGADGLRYYTSHLDRVDVVSGQEVRAGDIIGTIGMTGDSEACHVHVGLSPLCPQTEWSVRRGVVFPWPYLDAWRKGTPKSPVAEVKTWLTKNVAACEKAAADPNAAD